MRFKHQAMRKVFQKQSKLLHFEDRLQKLFRKTKRLRMCFKKVNRFQFWFHERDSHAQVGTTLSQHLNEVTEPIFAQCSINIYTGRVLLLHIKQKTNKRKKVANAARLWPSRNQTLFKRLQ